MDTNLKGFSTMNSKVPGIMFSNGLSEIAARGGWKRHAEEWKKSCIECPW